MRLVEKSRALGGLTRATFPTVVVFISISICNKDKKYSYMAHHLIIIY